MSLAFALAPLTSFVILFAMFAPLERLFPARPGQPILRPRFGTDLAFYLGQYWVFGLVATWGLSHVAALLAPVQPKDVAAWVGARPLVVQAAIALLCGDLFVYWFHRACHHFDWLWRFHAVHHSSEHLDWLAAHREHPVDGLGTQLAINLPGMLLGLPFEAMGPAYVFRGVWAIFVHSNTRLPLGPLKWVIGSPALHHYHHRRDAREVYNYANLAPYLDLLFGTHHLPEGETEDYAIGIEGRWPRGYLAQLAYPLVLFLPEAARLRVHRLVTVGDPRPPSEAPVLR